MTIHRTWHTLININNTSKFNSLFRVCLIFYTYIHELQKSIGNKHHEKNATRYCAGPAYYRMCSTDVYCSKQTGSSSTERKPSPIISSFLELGRENCVLTKICGGAENVVKTETQQTFVNGLLGFITLGIYILRWKRIIVLLTIIAWVAIDMGNSIYYKLICMGSFQLFLHSDRPLSEGDNPVQRCLPVRGRLHYPRRRRWWLHAWRQTTFTMCNRRRPAATSSRRASCSFSIS